MRLLPNGIPVSDVYSPIRISFNVKVDIFLVDDLKKKTDLVREGCNQAAINRQKELDLTRTDVDIQGIQKENKRKGFGVGIWQREADSRESYSKWVRLCWDRHF